MNIPPLADGHYAIFLEGYRCTLCLGVTEEERHPQAIQLDIAAIVRRLGDGDGIEDVVDYNHLRDVAISLANQGHIGLQETLCERVIEALQNTHPTIVGVIVQSRKLSVFADAHAAGCHMARIDPAAIAR